jgi:hypothetical protein
MKSGPIKIHHFARSVVLPRTAEPSKLTHYRNTNTIFCCEKKERKHHDA